MKLKVRVEFKDGTKQEFVFSDWIDSAVNYVMAREVADRFVSAAEFADNVQEVKIEKGI